jgi:hypothetical protein
MIVFTLRLNGTPEAYDKSLSALSVVYPEIEVIDADDRPEGKHAGLVTDKLRISMLSEMWVNDDVLYLDMDCIAKKRIDPCCYTKPSFPNLSGGILDYWAIFKPKGHEQFFIDLLNTVDWNRWAHIQRIINSKFRKNVGIIYGYPTFEYLAHSYLSQAKE